MLVTPFRADQVDHYVSKAKASWEPRISNLLRHDRIRKLELDRCDDMYDIKFHYSLMNHGRSIESQGLKSTIGGNSKNLDEQEAIYFSWGIEGVLHNWDVWLKWKMCQIYNPIAAQCGLKCDPKEAMRFAGVWYEYVESQRYRENKDLLEPVFEYEKSELESSYYFSLGLESGVDFDPDQDDPKKELIQYSEYACEIYGSGISTDVFSQKAEKWNMSTPLGKSVTIEPERLCHLVTKDGETALDVLCYLYRTYMDDCNKRGIEPPKFALLDQFITFCIDD